MPILLNRMPFSEYPSHVTVNGEPILVRADQIILWVTLGLQRLKIPNPSAKPFPVILDTGHTHSFSIHERHLVEWAGLQSDALQILSGVRDRGQRLLQRAANIWVHSNQRGEREKLEDQPPHRVEAFTGIAVYPGDEFPRLPIFGLRAIRANKLILNVDGKRGEATLRSSRKWWPFSSG